MSYNHRFNGLFFLNMNQTNLTDYSCHSSAMPQAQAERAIRVRLDSLIRSIRGNLFGRISNPTG